MIFFPISLLLGFKEMTQATLVYICLYAFCTHMLVCFYVLRIFIYTYTHAYLFSPFDKSFHLLVEYAYGVITYKGINYGVPYIWQITKTAMPYYCNHLDICTQIYTLKCIYINIYISMYIFLHAPAPSGSDGCL